MTTMNEESELGTLEAARDALKRAYLLVSYGNLGEALHICSDVTREFPDHPMAPTMEGAFLIAAGKPQVALKHLAKVVRRFPDAALAKLYFCEACLLSGRLGRGIKELDGLDEALLNTEELREFAGSLREVIEGLGGKAPDVVVVENLEL